VFLLVVFHLTLCCVRRQSCFCSRLLKLMNCGLFNQLYSKYWQTLSHLSRCSSVVYVCKQTLLCWMSRYISIWWMIFPPTCDRILHVYFIDFFDGSFMFTIVAAVSRNKFCPLIKLCLCISILLLAIELPHSLPTQLQHLIRAHTPLERPAFYHPTPLPRPYFLP
jgi:hypothetical protein